MLDGERRKKLGMREVSREGKAGAFNLVSRE
jgi:hypothetical protein